MPTSDVVTEELRKASYRWVKTCADLFLGFPCHSTCIMFIHYLYECALNLATPLNEKPSSKHLNALFTGEMSDDKKQFHQLRHNLIHNFHRINNVQEFVSTKLVLLGKDKLCIIASLCGLDGNVIWNAFMEYCDSDYDKVLSTTPTLVKKNTYLDFINDWREKI